MSKPRGSPAELHVGLHGLGLAAALALLLACPSRAPHEGAAPVEGAERQPDPSSSGASDPDRTSGSGSGSGSVDRVGTDCERVCGQLYDCLLVEPAPTATPHQASALELECLHLCTEAGPALADSRFAACGEPQSCAALMPCMRAAWPAAPSEPDPPALERSGSEGCRTGCKRLGECFTSAPDDIDECARGCEDKLEPEQAEAFGECTQIADCLGMLECMRAFPGA